MITKRNPIKKRGDNTLVNNPYRIIELLKKRLFKRIIEKINPKISNPIRFIYKLQNNEFHFSKTPIGDNLLISSLAAIPNFFRRSASTANFNNF